MWFGFCGWYGMLKTITSSSFLFFSFLPFVYVSALAGKRVLWLHLEFNRLFGRICAGHCLVL